MELEQMMEPVNILGDDFAQAAAEAGLTPGLKRSPPAKSLFISTIWIDISRNSLMVDVSRSACSLRLREIRISAFCASSHPSTGEASLLISYCGSEWLG